MSNTKQPDNTGNRNSERTSSQTDQTRTQQPTAGAERTGKPDERRNEPLGTDQANRLESTTNKPTTQQGYGQERPSGTSGNQTGSSRADEGDLNDEDNTDRSSRTGTNTESDRRNEGDRSGRNDR